MNEIANIVGLSQQEAPVPRAGSAIWDDLAARWYDTPAWIKTA